MKDCDARRNPDCVLPAVGVILLLFACATSPGYRPQAGPQPTPPPAAEPEEAATEGHGRPRVMVVVKTIPESGIITVEDSMLATEEMEAMVIDAFRARVFPVVDPAAVGQNLRKGQLRRILDGDTRAAAGVGLDGDADVVVAGTAQESEEHRGASGTGEPADFIKVKLSARAIKTATGEVLGSTLVETEEPYDREMVRRRAADSAAAELSAQILKTWKGRTSVTMIYADNADAQRVRLLKSTIVSEVREVDSIVTYSLAGRSAVVVVYSALTSDQLLAQMDRCTTAVPFTIKGLSGTRIDIRFLDAPGECKPELK